MIYKLKDPRIFRKKFALFPRKISDVWIWLEWFDATGWYYDFNKCPNDLIKSVRYPSQL